MLLWNFAELSYIFEVYLLSIISALVNKYGVSVELSKFLRLRV